LVGANIAQVGVRLPEWHSNEFPIYRLNPYACSWTVIERLTGKGGRILTRVYVDMAADLFHYGHVEFLKNARAFGDHLLVGVNSDETVGANKRHPILNMEERIACVGGCRYVDEVVPDAPWITDAAWIEEHRIDLVVHGDDYAQEQIEHCYKDPIAMGIFRTVPYTPTISTTEIIRRCKAAK
jgi:ethanolamine-phosphate cytidylyltransferase/choline-phosphate cytidylyltransferase